MRGRLISMSATAIMAMGTMFFAGEADVHEVYQEEIQQIYVNQTEAADEVLKINLPDQGVVARTHDVHMYTQEDADMIKRVAMAEAGTEGADGLWMVASVIANRINDPDFPSTASAVLRQKNAFATVSNGAYLKVTVISDECEEAWQRIEAGDICPKIVAFETLDSDVLDQWFMPAFEYRNHRFYTKKE